jgi:hypothetical protein
LKFWNFTMDLSENGKCLFTSMQYVESSHAPYQRIRFFLFSLQETNFPIIILSLVFQRSFEISKYLV